jgi:hypothetical protein
MNITGVIFASLLSVAAAPTNDASREEVVRAASAELAKHGFDVTSDESKLALSVKVERAKRGFVARVQIIERDTKEVVVSARRKFLRAADAAEIGRAVGRVLSAGLKAEDLDVEPIVEEKKKESRVPTHKPVVVRVTEPDVSSAPGETMGTVAARNYSSPEDRSLLISVGLGSQLSSAYAVVVGGETTGLGYALGAAPLVRIQARSTPFTVPLALEAELDWAAVRYSVALEGVDAPFSPAGHFLDLRAGGSWDFDLAQWSGGGLQLSPKVGLGYRALAVEAPEQGALVLGSHWVAPQAGLGLGLRVADVATIEAHGIARAILGYTEKPSTSGENGGGLGMTLGGGFRYWISDGLAIAAGIEYEYAQINTEGAGTRATFRGDPVLSDAQVLHSELRATAGVTFAR